MISLLAGFFTLVGNCQEVYNFQNHIYKAKVYCLDQFGEKDVISGYVLSYDKNGINIIDITSASRDTLEYQKYANCAKYIPFSSIAKVRFERKQEDLCTSGIGLFSSTAVISLLIGIPFTPPAWKGVVAAIIVFVPVGILLNRLFCTKTERYTFNVKFGDQLNDYKLDKLSLYTLLMD
jgi:hypothetical protein